MAADQPDRLPVTAAHRAIQELVDDGDLLLSWHLTFEAVTPAGQKWIGHRGGGGHDGTDAPMIWSVIGLLEAALASAHDQLADLSREPWPEDDDEEEPDPG